MTLWLWVPVLLAAWLIAGLALALVIGPFLGAHLQGPYPPGSDEEEAP